ncbi:MAG: hypothetical protein LUI87_06970, partial [Lachnospiraceae bacterium]|nr:hypothetical protein [Lachnospiraceae bacterium]
MEQILILSDCEQMAAASDLKDTIISLSGADTVQIDTRLFEESRGGCDYSLIFLIIPVLRGEDSGILENLDELCRWSREQHLPLIPVQSAEQNVNDYPDSLGKLHFLSVKDKKYTENLLKVLRNHLNVFSEMDEEANRIAAGEILLKDCTSRQLFRYATAILHGNVVQKDIKDALRIFRFLIGCDAFVPNAIDTSLIPEYTSELFDFCSELNTYLKTEITNALQAADYRDAVLFMDTCQLLQKISSEHLFNYNTDDALRLTKNILLQYFKNDSSLKAGKWLLNYYWDEASRAVRNRYFFKAVDSLLEMLSISEKICASYSDLGVLGHMYSA